MCLLKIASNSGSFSETSSHVLSLHRDTSVEKVAKEELPREKAPQSSAVLCVSGIYSPGDYPAARQPGIPEPVLRSDLCGTNYNARPPHRLVVAFYSRAQECRFVGD